MTRKNKSSFHVILVVLARNIDVEEGYAVLAIAHQQPLPFIADVLHDAGNGGLVLVSSEAVSVEECETATTFIRPTAISVPGLVSGNWVQHGWLVRPAMGFTKS